jgi:energy-coupling factor transporter ATP-binding protein EcfA2
MKMNPKVPSRDSNPFATCWTRPGAIAFQFAAGQSGAELVARLAAAGWRGEIVGPHGSGKSTLVASLTPLVSAAGRTVTTLTLRAGERRLPPKVVGQALAAARPLVIVDGFEQLSWWQRRLLVARCRRASAGLLVTSHVATGLPLLYATRPDLPLARAVVSTLTARIPSLVTAADVAASHACHGSNLRELLFALYERHEAVRPAARFSERTFAGSLA